MKHNSAGSKTRDFWKEPHAVLASEIIKKKLDAGPTVFLKQVYPARIVCLGIWVRVGSIYENEKNAGLSHFVEHMLFRSTENRGVGQIAKEIQSLGGYLNGFTSWETTCYWMVLPSKYLEYALEIQADAVLHPLFLPEEVEKESDVICEEIHMGDDRPEHFIFEKLLNNSYKIHPYRRPVIGYEKVVRGITPENLFRHHQKYYHSGNIFLVMVGDLDIPKAINWSEKYFAGIRKGRKSPLPKVKEPTLDGPVHVNYTGDIRNAYIALSFRIPEFGHPDIYACDLLANLLAEGKTSRLQKSLVEKKGLVARIDAGIISGTGPGLLVLDALLSPAKIEKAIHEIYNEFHLLLEKGISDEELQKAKNQAESYYVLNQETVEGQMRNIGHYEILGDYRMAEDYVIQLKKVTREDIISVAKKYLRPENSCDVTYHPERGKS
ncbi:MAG: insulinase family protein [Candidatus Eremiobacteraeota bacterium]|nr:insulinase family protein [Candidatus Eremiobacteraeota bacterium]